MEVIVVECGQIILFKVVCDVFGLIKGMLLKVELDGSCIILCKSVDDVILWVCGKFVLDGFELFDVVVCVVCDEE